MKEQRSATREWKDPLAEYDAEGARGSERRSERERRQAAKMERTQSRQVQQEQEKIRQREAMETQRQRDSAASNGFGAPASTKTASSYAGLKGSNGATTVPPTDAAPTRWPTFESYWQDVGRERFRRMKNDFKNRPPQFQMPRLRFFGRPWDMGKDRALNGPVPEDMPTTVKHQTLETKEEKAARERQHALEQRALKDTSFCRLYGFQVIAISMWVIGAAYIYHRFRMQFWRFLCWYTLIFFQVIFASNWIKSVMKLRNILFMWLHETMEHVEECGEVVIMNIRRQLFSRVYGMLICDEVQHLQLLKKHGRAAVAQYAPELFEHVEFTDDYGSNYKFMQDKEGGSACSIDTGKTFKVPPDRQLGLTMCVDLDGKLVSDLMKEDDWFAKLEFRLLREGPLVPEYQEYLGSFIFGDGIRFAFVMAVFPVVSYVGCFLAYTRIQELYSTHVYLDSILMQKHFAVVLGMSLFAIVSSVLCRGFLFIYMALNLCMLVVECGVRGELLRHYPTVGDEDNPHNVQDIAVLWRKATTEQNVKEIGEKLWDRVHNFGHQATRQFVSLL